MINDLTKEEAEIQTIIPIGKNIYNYDEIVCPNCNRHIFWSIQNKEFHCSCGAILIIEKKKTVLSK